MIKVNIVAVGKVKEKYFADGIKEYQKRLSKYCDLTITEVAEETFDKVGVGEISKIIEREGERIRKHLKGFVVAMCIEGEKVSSEQFSSLISKGAEEKGVITFVIGGSYGLSDEIKANAQKVSFGAVTFPHTLMRLILTEQVYRAFNIINGTPYHK